MGLAGPSQGVHPTGWGLQQNPIECCPQQQDHHHGNGQSRLMVMETLSMRQLILWEHLELLSSGKFLDLHLRIWQLIYSE